MKAIIIKTSIMLIFTKVFSIIIGYIKTIALQDIAMTQMDNPSLIAMTAIENANKIEMFGFIIIPIILILLCAKDIKKLIKKKENNKNENEKNESEN